MSILFYCEGDDGQLLKSIRQRLPEHTVTDWLTERPLLNPADITAAIVWMPPDDFFDELENLEAVYAFSAGVDHLLKHPGLPENTAIIRLRDAGMAQQMAEYALYGVLHSQRRMGLFREAQKQGRWAHEINADSATTTCIGIMGAGALGLQVAERLAMNSYQVKCWSRTQRQRMPNKDMQRCNNGDDSGSRSDGANERLSLVHGQDALGDFLASSNILICLLPLTDATTGILDKCLFTQLPQGAFLINPGRGNHLVEADLLQALDSGQLSGALLDVFSIEPLPEEHPFWQHPAIIITPHVAAKSLIKESLDQIIDSLHTFERGETPHGVIDRRLGY